ncbi:restriction endonuclease subunit S domain-containing protein [Aminipila luticellarii]|nr:restriction endonuclease subunit S [Aminipila luticellarii]
MSLFDSRNLLEDSYYKKIEKGDIMCVDENDILISFLLPQDPAIVGKFIRIRDKDKDIYFSTAFLRLKARKCPQILYYCLKSLFYHDMVSIARIRKGYTGYATLSKDDLKDMRFSKKIIDTIFDNQERISDLIANKEREIDSLNDSILTAQEIIDSVFKREFEINTMKLYEIDCSKKQTISFNSYSDKNINCRLSYRWNKAVEIQNELTREVGCCQPLGLHILDTQNGWSPDCSEDSGDYQVLGLDAINKTGALSFDNPKYSSEYKKDFEKYVISNGNFFVSRGNTTDLVSLASIAFIDDEVPTTIYPDLMIKITFDSNINTPYMAYAINSFIGRLYFKYASKGKNQTMVKVSPRELSDFMVPIPDIKTQEKIVCDIQAEIRKQDNIKEKIFQLRKQIDEMIIKTIKQ